jgi:hypothetical protein
MKDIETSNSADLRKYYFELLGQPPPPKASLHFLKGQIAWTLQAQQCGEDPHALRQSLLEKVTSTIHNNKKKYYKPGTRLVREWQGHVYEVTVLENGYEHGGELYRSLSHVAKSITGAHCSGPRFFGVTKSA